jgi:CRP/FNR family cyclic AMP-dependent transcriptional regulator
MGRLQPDPGTLDDIAFLAALPSDERERFLSHGRVVRFDPGQVIIERAQPARAMYVVTQGTARVDVGGRYHDLKRGALVGEMGLLSSKPRMRTVTALDGFEALEIETGDLDAFLRENPGVAIAMLKIIAERLREVEERLDAWMGVYVA